MTLAQQVRQQAGQLTDAERAALAVELLESLPAILDDEDGGSEEAQRRDQELDNRPTLAVSWEQIRRGLGR